ncbi:MAG: SPFH domain-containing protein [Anaerolineales bacterium]|nr:SPFH domain-containing protein [Anaerolineales bacterium]MCA9930738.1 SPFH domain-containing protein [Anaerolineales bacterium]
MNTLISKPPYKERLLHLIGHIRINQDHLGVVFRNGRFAYFLQPGWHTALNRWSEELVAHIPIKMHAADTTLTLRSTEGFDLQTRLSVWFKFDPSKAKAAYRSRMTAVALSRDCDMQLKALVLREAGYSLRKEAGNYAGKLLITGDTLSRLERAVRHYLQTTLMDFGILTHLASSVLIEMLTLPDGLAAMQQKTYMRQETMAAIRENPTAVLQAQLLETMAQQENVFYMNGRCPGSVIDQLFNAAFP